MSQATIKRDYLSDAGTFLADFDQREDATSEARKAEERKYEELNRLRDEPEAKKKSNKLWSGF